MNKFKRKVLHLVTNMVHQTELSQPNQSQQQSQLEKSKHNQL